MNIAIIGGGAMGALHAGNALSCGHKLVACGDVRIKQAEAIAKQFGCEATDECPALLQREDIDAVVITTPTPTHLEYIKTAAGNGKHIFCEKPLALTVRECEEAIEAAAANDVKLFVGHVVRYFQEFEAIRGQVAAGKVGKPGYVKTYRGGMFPHGAGAWFRDFGQSGGVTLDCSIHDLDWIRYVFGDVTRVYCQRAYRTEPDPMDYAMVTLRLASGLIADVIGTWAHPTGFRVKAEVCGDKGVIQFDSAEAPVNVQLRQTDPSNPSVIVPGSPVEKSPYLLEWEDFTAWLESGREPRVNPDDAAEAVRIAQAALKSAETGEPVTL